MLKEVVFVFLDGTEVSPLAWQSDGVGSTVLGITPLILYQNFLGLQVALFW